MTKLSRSEVEAIARAVIDRIFAGSSVVGAPLRVTADTEWIDPDYVRIEVVHQTDPVGFDAERRMRAVREISEQALEHGDERSFGVIGDYSQLARPAA
jgi:hypothetical protein